MEDKLTEGQKLVGKTFNPSDNKDVEEVKQLTAKLIDKINDIHAKRQNSSYNTNLIHGAATRKIMSASMWAVKDVTWTE